MLLIGRGLLDEFRKRHADAISQIDSWIAEVEEATWENPEDIKRSFPRAKLPGKRQTIFKICWNKYRLWALVDYKQEIVHVKKIGTHKEYDKWQIK